MVKQPQQQNIKAPTLGQRLSQWLKGVRQSWPIQLLEIGSFFGIILAVIVFILDLSAQKEQRIAQLLVWEAQDRERIAQQEERKARQEEREARERERHAQRREREAQERERQAQQEERKARQEEREARERERKAQEEQRVARAWTQLTTKAPGNSGKLWALEYLHTRNEPLFGIDLSPGPGRVGAYLREAKLGKATFVKADLTGADLSGAELAGTLFYESDLTDVQFWSLSFTRIRFETKLKKDNPALFEYYEQVIEQFVPSLVKQKFPSAFQPRTAGTVTAQERKSLMDRISSAVFDTLKNVSVQGADVVRRMMGDYYQQFLDGMTIRRCNVSGARFFEPAMENVTFESSWAWSDNPPIGLPKSMLDTIALCDRTADAADPLFIATGTPYGCIKRHSAQRN